jgi:hypothetical protein
MKSMSETSPKMMPKSMKWGIGSAVENHRQNVPEKYAKVKKMACQTDATSE